MSDGDVMMRLECMEFPESTREALQYIVTSLASQEGTAIPGLSEGSETVIGEICQSFIHFRSPEGVKKLTAMEELQLLEMLCDFFKAAPEKHKYQLFQAMFGGLGDEQSNTLLSKMVSMALSVSYKSVLDCAAIWMQERTCHSSESLVLTSRLVEDYCLLFPDPSNTFHTLPKISPLFVCNFTTAVTALFAFTSPESVPPLSLLEHMTGWVTQDCTLCCESLRQLPIHGTCSSPVPGLLAWCVLGPVVCSNLLRDCRAHPLPNSYHCPSSTFSSSSSQRGKLSQDTLRRTMTVLSRLHLGVLQSVDFFCRSGSSLSQCLLSVTDFMCLITQLSSLVKQCGGEGLVEHPQPEVKVEGAGALSLMLLKEESGDEGGTVAMAMERLAQVLQVARMAGCLMVQRGSMAELGKMALKHLPSNRLLNMVVSMADDV